MKNQQEWKWNSRLYNAPTRKENNQTKKELDYYNEYVKYFIAEDPIRDWESISRCIWLWEWAINHLEHGGLAHDPTKWSVLDCGCKDAQFPEWLREQSIMSLGVEIDERYIKYATKKGRPVYYGDVCNLTFDNNQFDFVFSHHLHGLLPDYLLGLQEMFKVSSKYMLALNQIPGNPRKHYSYIDSSEIFNEFIDSVECDVLYNDFLDTGFSNEWVIFLRKHNEMDHLVGELDDEVTLLETLEEQHPNADNDVEFKTKKENPFEE